MKYVVRKNTNKYHVVDEKVHFPYQIDNRYLYTYKTILLSTIYYQNIVPNIVILSIIS